MKETLQHRWARKSSPVRSGILNHDMRKSLIMIVLCAIKRLLKIFPSPAPNFEHFPKSLRLVLNGCYKDIVAVTQLIMAPKPTSTRLHFNIENPINNMRSSKSLISLNHNPKPKILLFMRFPNSSLHL